jgi:hypothetical protein
MDNVKEGGRIKSFKKGGSEGEKMNSSGEIASHVVKLPTFLFLFKTLSFSNVNLVLLEEISGMMKITPPRAAPDFPFITCYCIPGKFRRFNSRNHSHMLCV